MAPALREAAVVLPEDQAGLAVPVGPAAEVVPVAVLRPQSRSMFRFWFSLQQARRL